MSDDELPPDVKAKLAAMKARFKVKLEKDPNLSTELAEQLMAAVEAQRLSRDERLGRGLVSTLISTFWPGDPATKAAARGRANALLSEMFYEMATSADRPARDHEAVVRGAVDEAEYFAHPNLAAYKRGHLLWMAARANGLTQDEEAEWADRQFEAWDRMTLDEQQAAKAWIVEEEKGREKDEEAE